MRNILVFIICLTLFLSLCIAFDLTPYLRGPAPYPPEWRWDYLFVNTYSKIWLPILVCSLIVLVFKKLELEKEDWISKNQIVVIAVFTAFGFIFQLSTLFFNRAGIEVLLHRIINPGLNGYFTSSVEIANVFDFFRNFNNIVLNLHQHAEGHPPLSVLFFYFINKLFLLVPFLNSFVEMISPNTDDVRTIWNSLLPNEKLGALFSTLFIPFLSSLVIVPLFYISKKLYGQKSAVRTAFLYCFIPGIALFQPINDVFITIFPLFSLLLFIKALDRRSLVSAFASGVIFTVGLLFSLSLLPLLVVFGVYGLKFLKQIKTISVFAISLLLIPFALLILFGFNSITVFKTIMSGLPESRSYLSWVIYNPYDFCIFLGPGIAILYIHSLYKSHTGSVSAKFKNDPLLLGTLIMILLLISSGSVRGEVGRIWIPFMPFLLLPVVGFITSKKGLNFSSKEIIFLALSQIGLILVINEYWVTLW